MMNNISSAGRGTLLQGVGGGQSSPGDNGRTKAGSGKGSGLGAKGRGKAKGHDKAKGKSGKGSGKVKNKSGKGSGKVKNKSGSGSGSGSGKNITNTPTNPSLDPMQILEGLRAKVQILQPQAPTVEPLAELPTKLEPEITNQVPVLTPDGQIVNGTVAFAPLQPIQQQPILQQQPIQQAPIQQAPTFIQDTTFLGGQGFDPNSTAGKIAIAASSTPIVQTGDPVADRVNAFIRNTNILLNSTGSQSIGGGF